jgi:FkbM family methyltransferase
VNLRIIGNLVSGPLFQPLWRKLHKLSLHRMNYGRGATVRGSGEEWVLNYLKRKNEQVRPFVVFDIGAYTGEYTEKVLAVFGDQTQVSCFEPNETTFTILKSSHGAKQNVRLYNFGLGDREESRVLYANGETSSMASLYHRRSDRLNIPGDRISQIPLTTLDLFCKGENIDRIDFLKMDVEGHELKILNGAENMIRSGSIRFIQFEFGDCNVYSRTFLRDFLDLLRPHYRVFRILHRGLSPIGEYDEALEVLKVTNYLAEKVG